MIPKVISSCDYYVCPKLSLVSASIFWGQHNKVGNEVLLLHLYRQNNYTDY